MRLLLLFLISMKVLATVILFLLTVDYLGNPYSTIILTQTTPLIYCYIIYCFFLIAIVAGIRVYSFIAIYIPASVTAFPSKLIFGFTFMSVMVLNQCRLPSGGYFSSILLTPRPYITKISLTRSVLTKPLSIQSYIIVLQLLLPVLIQTLNYQATVQSFY